MRFKIDDKIISLNIVNALMFLYVLSLYLFTYREGLNQISNALALLLILNIWIEHIKYRKNFVINKTLTFYFVFINISLFSVLYALDQNLAITRTRTLILLFVLILSLANYLDDFIKLKKLMKYFFYSGFISSLYILITSDFSNISRFGDQLGNVNAIGIILGISVTFAIYFILSQKNYYFLIPVFIIISTILLTGSRKSLLFLLINIIIILYLKNSKNFIEKLKFILVLTIILIITIYLLFNVNIFYDILGNRIENLFDFIFYGGTKEGSINERFLMIQEGIEMFRQRPLLGYGTDNYRVLFARTAGGRLTYSHNNLIEMLVNFGLIGSFIYYFMQFVVIIDLYKSIKLIKDKLLAYTFIALIISYIIQSVGLVYYYNKQYAIILIMASLVYKITIRNNKNL